ncbi:uncharacterized protein LOC117903741 [Drosophila subobscura]|uniref:uncharacterized protein LOC117903741 n=1 Tax=Drosophila subobscura TaxID=7241 RepID=UPI00155A0C98|nr:uncharacterized protein LOC117903741 [Drosophila subobscura]
MVACTPLGADICHFIPILNSQHATRHRKKKKMSGMMFEHTFQAYLENVPRFQYPLSQLGFDSKEISEKICEVFHDINSDFRANILNLKETCTTHKDHKLYKFGLLLQMPFKVTATEGRYVQGTLSHDLKADVKHPVVKGGKVDPQLLLKSFEKSYKKALGHIGQLKTESGKSYTFKLTSGYADGRAVFEMNTFDAGVKVENLLFKFPLAYIFEADPNIYVGTRRHFAAFELTREHGIRISTRKVLDFLMLLTQILDIPARQMEDIYHGYLDVCSPHNKTLFRITWEALLLINHTLKHPDVLRVLLFQLVHYRKTNSVDLAAFSTFFAGFIAMHKRVEEVEEELDGSTTS